MFRLSAPLPLAFLLLTLAFVVDAQEKDPPEAAARQQAFELLEEVAEGIPGLRASENRVFLAVTVADLLWSKDEKGARALFDVATREVLARISAFDPAEPDHYNSFNTIQQQRRETIERMARHDPQLALEFLRSTQFPATSSMTQNLISNERELELLLAGQIAEKDPAQSLRLGRAALKKGMSYGVASFLHQLHAKDNNAAQAFYGELVDRLKRENLLENHEAMSAAISLLGSYQPPRAKDETFRELFNVLLGVFLSSESNTTSFVQQHHHNVRLLVNLAHKYEPGRVAGLLQWRQRAVQLVDPGLNVHRELNEIGEQASVDQILALAEKYPPEVQSHVYQRAAWKAMSEGNVERARQLITDFVKDPSQQRSLLEQLDNQLLWNKISQNKLSEARQMIARIKRPEQGVEILMHIAMNASNRGDRDLAFELLEEARALLDSLEMNSNKLRAQIQLARNYSSLDAERGVTLLEPIIAQVNELVTAAAVLDGFENRYLKDGEWNNRNHTNLGNLLYSLQEVLGQLARANFESARKLSSRLNRLEIRLAAQLAITQSVLTETNLDVQRRRPLIRLAR